MGVVRICKCECLDPGVFSVFWTISSFISSASASVCLDLDYWKYLHVYSIHIIFSFIYTCSTRIWGNVSGFKLCFLSSCYCVLPLLFLFTVETRLTNIFQASCSFGCLVRGTEKNTALSLSTLAAGFRWFSRIRPYWKQTPASLRGAPFTTEPWLFKANLGCLEVNFFDYVDSAIDVCLSLDVICSLISIGSHGSLVPSIAGLP